ncbi:hypothetical protein GDO78_018007 [Eleutherodactylus coqui]|uniref:Uncharacterized protein n=1 Tax=Eleutherodactylus coqui TaxID=57060 RepID=A0A8J6E5W6_ELECQ|nr:hypothetical protein GDO78_018007 [Eleutherodactylus coqui]
MLSSTLLHSWRGQPLSTSGLLFKLPLTYSLPWKQRQVKSQNFKGILSELKKHNPPSRSRLGQSLSARGFWKWVNRTLLSRCFLDRVLISHILRPHRRIIFRTTVA